MTETFSNVDRPPLPGVSYPCPCCGEHTLDARGVFEICPVCDWQDDGQDDHDADAVRGGPNGDLSLTGARERHRRRVACDAATPIRRSA